MHFAQADSDLGPLDDPTPAERALSMLRSAWEALGDTQWPNVTFKQVDGAVIACGPVLLVEDRALYMAHVAFRCSSEASRAFGRKINCVAGACYWASEALRAKDRRDDERERRMADRAIEILGWIDGR